MIYSNESIPSSSPPRFIVLEGVNGAGKTTLQKKINTYLSELNYNVVTTREPGGTELGKQIRSMVLGAAKGDISERAEVLLFAADRAHHVEQLIKPAIENNKIVVCDRYIYSTLAFQGYGRGFDLDAIWQINSIAIGGVLPDLVILLDLDPEAGINRNKMAEAKSKTQANLAPAKDGPDAFEFEDLSFHARIRDGFLALAKSRSEPFVIVDASKGADQVWDDVKNILRRFYGK